MHSAKDISPDRGWMTAIPLAVAYGAVPLGNLVARLSGSGFVSPYAPWLLLASGGLLMAMRRPAPGAEPRKGFLLKLALFLLMGFGLLQYSRDIVHTVLPWLPWLQELAPLVFLLFCGLWVTTCGLPDRADFQRYGGLLGLLCLVDLGVEAMAYGSVPTIRWIGNADILAGLLLVSLCASLKPGDNDGGLREPDQGNKWWRALIMIGLLACLSRTGLFAGAWVVLCFGRGKARYRLLYSLGCVVCLAITFVLPPTATDAIRYIDYWLWVEALRFFAEAPVTLFTGFPIGSALPVNFPPAMVPIWEAATGQPASFGVFTPHVPSFWLRLTLAWGSIASLALLTVVFGLLVRRLTRLGAGLTAALFAQGMTTPLLYDPAMAVSISLAFILALSAQAAPVDEPLSPEEPESDPAKEWDMRPL